MDALQKLNIQGDLYARAVLRAVIQQEPQHEVTHPDLVVIASHASTQAPFFSLNDAVTTPAPAPSMEASFRSESTPSPLNTFGLSSASESSNAVAPASSPDATNSENTDRINELLRQFRERYGNS